MHPGQAPAQPAGPDGLSLDRPDGPNPHPGEVLPFFTKTGSQRDCDHVVYDLRFGARGEPARFLDPLFVAHLKSLRMDFKDQLPAGLKIVGVEVSGDGTDAAGGPLPSGTRSSTAATDDTAELVDFRLSAADLDGVGALGERHVDIRITAAIDRAAFPAAAIVESQGVVSIAVPGAPGLPIPSHDPGRPDDGDFWTGEPTGMLIDVTGCEASPALQGSEPCFDVALGDVGCGADGAFTYHMPVGPELAGKWVELATTAPGVVVAPEAQLVPAGGGTLDWTITGASPGDMVRLLVTGIDTEAGPREGVGLCCTQTIDIVIPHDLDCPDGMPGPDPEVGMVADAARCTEDGGCDFTIRVTNAGGSPYSGPIVLEAVTGPGPAALVAGPGVPWACAPTVSPMRCTHPATTLDPGESTELKLGFAPGSGWGDRFIRACASYDHAASGREFFGRPGNDRACARVPICVPGRDRECTPPPRPLVDLGITKDRLAGACSAEGVCPFVIRVFNHGSETYDGPLTVVETYPAGAPSSSSFGPTPPWSCAEEEPGRFRCDHPGIALPPWGTGGLTVRATVPDGYGSGLVRNCGELAAIEGETDLANNRACADMRVPSGSDRAVLGITKACEESAGPSVSCRVTVTNAGSAAPLGPVRVADAAVLAGAGTPLTLESVTPDGPEWSCGPLPAASLVCRITGGLLAPGASRHFDVTAAVPANTEFENCATGSFGPVPGDDIVRPFGRACARGNGVGLRVEKTGDRECRAGRPCTFEITIANDGAEGFAGPVRIGDAVGLDGIGRLEGVPVAAIEPPFGCLPEPSTLPLSCIADLSLEPGEARVHRVTVVIPDDGRLAAGEGPVEGRNCVGVLPPGTPVAGGGGMVASPLSDGAGEGRSYACHAFTLVGEVTPECSAGFVLSDQGRCVCPPGTSFRNGRCRGLPVSDPRPTGQCRLLPGQIRTETGQCVCPVGTELRKGRCERDEPPQCRLLPGQIRTSDERCVCPRGTELRNGRCVRDEPPQCRLLPGQIRTSDGRCICPRGTELRRGRCVKDEPPQCRLLPGQIRTSDGRCICPRGTELRNGRCVKDEPPQCRLLPGQIRTSDGRCVCPRGTELVRGACRQRVTTPDCPRGTRLVRGRCVRVDGAPTLRINPNLREQIAPRRLPPRTNDILRLQ